jgi:SAM-dependent methyltransferase
MNSAKSNVKEIERTWGSNESVNARIKRGRWSSGPNEAEIKIIKELFSKAIGKNRAPRTLVLGATPELRDLAISMGSDVLAVDISINMLSAMTSVMEHRESDKNKFMRIGWLEMDKYLLPESFDMVLADASLNNVPRDKNECAISIVSRLLKKGGYFITRNIVLNPETKQKNADDLIKEYNQGKNTPLGFFVDMALYSKLSERGFDRKNDELFWDKVMDDIADAARGRVSEQDMEYLDSIKMHGNHSSVVFSKKDFEDILKKHFTIESVRTTKEYTFSESLPIFFLRKK